MVERSPILDAWDEPQLDPLTNPPEELMSLPIEEAVEKIATWFFENFEDPAESTPYETAEGGYQYIWGGPYNARDVIENVFADTASEKLVTAAIEAVELHGHEWVPNGHRIQPPDDDADSPQNTEAAFAEMHRRIQVLEESLEQIRPAGLGHNNPPEPIEPTPLSSQEWASIQHAIAVLNSQPAIPQEAKISDIETAARTTETLGIKVKDWLVDRANDFSSEAVKEAGKEFGRWAVKLPAWGINPYIRY